MFMIRFLCSAQPKHFFSFSFETALGTLFALCDQDDVLYFLSFEPLQKSEFKKIVSGMSLTLPFPLTRSSQGNSSEIPAALVFLKNFFSFLIFLGENKTASETELFSNTFLSPASAFPDSLPTSLKCALIGSTFQKSTWRTLIEFQALPHAPHALSYSQLASVQGTPKGARAVARVMSTNSLLFSFLAIWLFLNPPVLLISSL